MFQDANKFWDTILCSNRWLSHTCWLWDLCLYCNLHINFWSLISILILPWPRVSTIAYSGVDLNEFKIFPFPSFLTLKPCMFVVNWGIFYKGQTPMYTMSFEKCVCVWSWYDAKYSSLPVPSWFCFQSIHKFRIFSLTLISTISHGVLTSTSWLVLIYLRVCVPVSHLEDDITEINWGHCSFRICSAAVKWMVSLPMTCLCERKESKTTWYILKAPTNMLKVTLFKAVHIIKDSPQSTYMAAHNHLELQFQGSNTRTPLGCKSSFIIITIITTTHTHTGSKYVFKKKSQ